MAVSQLVLAMKQHVEQAEGAAIDSALAAMEASLLPAGTPCSPYAATPQPASMQTGVSRCSPFARAHPLRDLAAPQHLSTVCCVI